MKHTYTIHGPFTIKKKEGLVSRNKDVKRNFWNEVRKTEESLPSACGCYLFAIRAGKGTKPCYVGLTGKQTFEHECFASQKLNIYNEALAHKKGAPVLFLLAKRTSKGKFVKPGKNRHASSEFLETFLIGVAIDKNPELMNIQKTKFLREMCVPQLINTPRRKPTRSESKFKKAIE